MIIEITLGTLTLTASLNDSLTAKKIIAALPLEGSANVWGEEIYFEVPVAVEPQDDAMAEVEVGTLAYWPTGCAFCIFFGPTPVSTNSMPRAYSPVNVFGSINGDTTCLKQVANGTKVHVHAITDPNV